MSECPRDVPPEDGRHLATPRPPAADLGLTRILHLGEGRTGLGRMSSLGNALEILGIWGQRVVAEKEQLVEKHKLV